MVGTTVPTHEITVRIKSCGDIIRLLKKSRVTSVTMTEKQKGSDSLIPRPKQSPGSPGAVVQLYPNSAMTMVGTDRSPWWIKFRPLK
jgi:hypothetical protein